MPANVFQKATAVLKQEAATYKATFDASLQANLNATDHDRQQKRNDFDAEIELGVASFEATFKSTLLQLKQHIAREKRRYEGENLEKGLWLQRYIDKKTNQTMQTLLAKAYSIGTVLDADDDFLKSDVLERLSEFHGTIAHFKTILWSQDVTMDMGLIAKIYRGVVGQDPPSLDPEHLVPLAVRVFANVLEHKTTARSQAKLNDSSTDESVAQYTTDPTVTQQQTWRLLTEVFAVYSLNQRMELSHVYEDGWDANQIAFQVASLVLHRYRESVQRIPSTPEYNASVLSWRPDTTKLDPVLTALPSYLTPDNFSMYMRRSAMALFLQPSEDGTALEIDLGYCTNMPQQHDHYLRHGGVARFDLSGSLLTINGVAGTEVSIRRFIASFWSTVTWEVHLGINHVLVGDEWNHSFLRSIDTEHPLTPLIRPVTFGVAAGVNLAGLILLNNLDTCIASALSNYTPTSLKKLTRRRVDSLKDFVHFPTISARLSGNNFPVVNALGHWWNVLEEFVSAYVDACDITMDTQINLWLSKLKIFSDTPTVNDLKTAITIMYFNAVVHELFSNEQMNHDAFNNRLIFVCDKRSSDEIPCAYVQERAVEVLVATSGASTQLATTDYGLLTTDETCLKVLNRLKASVQEIGQIMKADPQLYAQTLLPMNVEASVAW